MKYWEDDNTYADDSHDVDDECDSVYKHGELSLDTCIWTIKRRNVIFPNSVETNQ